MIKLIASDLDGTLFDKSGLPNEQTFSLIHELTRRGVLFCVASGRQYCNLTTLFAPVKDEAVFLAENGALVKYRGKTLYSNPIPDEYLPEALTAIRQAGGLYPILCCEENAYVESNEQPAYERAAAAYTKLVTVPSLNEIIGKEHVCKISIFDGAGTDEHTMRVLPQRLSRLSVTLSGRHWCDILKPGACKGDAIFQIKKHFSLKKEEVAAFGDHMNDYEMLKESGHAFVTENAYPPLKKLILNVVPANTEGGVQQTIEKFLQRGTL